MAVPTAGALVVAGAMPAVAGQAERSKPVGCVRVGDTDADQLLSGDRPVVRHLSQRATQTAQRVGSQERRPDHRLPAVPVTTTRCGTTNLINCWSTGWTVLASERLTATSAETTTTCRQRRPERWRVAVRRL